MLNSEKQCFRETIIIAVNNKMKNLGLFDILRYILMILHTGKYLLSFAPYNWNFDIFDDGSFLTLSDIHQNPLEQKLSVDWMSQLVNLKLKK